MSPSARVMMPIENWLVLVRAEVLKKAPDLVAQFDIYAEEACFGRAFIADDLANLPMGAKVLEIGAGSFLLSCQLCREGFNVTALEPLGQGFSHFASLQQIVLEVAASELCCPTVLSCSAENLSVAQRFDYAFSINVMEHVANAGEVLRRVMNSLLPNAKYRFTCPNYLFPYEPHFNIPTLFSKKLTEILFYSRIRSSSELHDPLALWRSLNWINVTQLVTMVKKMPGVRISFNRRFLVSTLARAVNDPRFSSRRSAWLRTCLRAVVGLRWHHLAGFIPAAMQPVIDCTVTAHLTEHCKEA